MWTASATGTPAEVRGQLSEQFKIIISSAAKPEPAKPPLAKDDDSDEAQAAVPAAVVSGNDAEHQVAQASFDLIETVLATIDPARVVSVSANADAGYAEKETRRAPFHNITVVVTCR